MIDFRPPKLNDKERIDAYVKASGRIGCDVSFTNTYLWRKHYNIQIAFTDDTYYKCYRMGESITGYAMPMTSGDNRTAIGRILDDARERGTSPIIGLLNDRGVGLMHRLYGDKVIITPDRDSFDYIYERENLVSLSGKKYHAKRNHISKFFRAYEDSVVEEICANNARDVLSVAERWQEGSGDTGELAIIKDALEHFDRLGMFGLLLYVNGDPVAFSLASAINDEVCDVNFEKAVGIEEAYAVINFEFAKHFDSFRYINREEDLGLEGLRKSKLSYHPDILLKKSNAVFSW